MDEHTPMMSAEYVDRVREWHENAYRQARAEAGPESGTGQTFEYLDRVLVVPPQVHPITGMSHLLGGAVLAEVRETDRVLDMGTGSGVNAILAASKSSRVVAVDINPYAVDAATANAERNGVADRVDVRHSDVFGAVDGVFDLIVFDPPFRWFAPRDLLEGASTDENYQAMTAFFTQAREHLTADGRMLIFFGSSGDLTYLRHLIDATGFTATVLAQQSLVRDGWQVDYFTFRLTGAQPA
ncbi:methyltransferase [Micromonospora sp. NBC_01796]|uniref:methyltransferase n=1 Tax=Micromonospora sp. NBC_01796 TaxID=2975987 RepID=UPI002DDA08BF|nr:methyltransferase [Micromonospora sp. NBC_01796]WSA83095.1 methyltransferase [Micromonospora sp. NBC_01796]